MTLVIPATVEELDAAWFRGALQLGRDGIEIEDARIVEVIRGTCTKIRVALDYGARRREDWPATMILKGGFAAHSPAFREMHETEMLYYRDIAPVAGFDTPRCWFAGLDPQSGRSAVLIEDLGARPVRWLSALDPLDWCDEAAFVDALAGFAARWWESPDLDEGGRAGWVIHSYEREAAAYIDHYLEPERWTHFVGLPRCACLSRAFHDRDRMKGALGQLALRLGGEPMTLSHGDTHLGNLYVNPDAGPAFSMHSRAARPGSRTSPISSSPRSTSRTAAPGRSRCSPAIFVSSAKVASRRCPISRRPGSPIAARSPTASSSS